MVLEFTAIQGSTTFFWRISTASQRQFWLGARHESFQTNSDNFQGRNFIKELCRRVRIFACNVVDVASIMAELLPPRLPFTLWKSRHGEIWRDFFSVQQDCRIIFC